MEVIKTSFIKRLVIGKSAKIKNLQNLLWPGVRSIGINLLMWIFVSPVMAMAICKPDIICHGPRLITSLNFDPSMDK